MHEKITPPVGFDKPIGWLQHFHQAKFSATSGALPYGETEVVIKIFDGTHFVDYDSPDGLAVRNDLLKTLIECVEELTAIANHPAVSIPPLGG